MRGTPEKIRRAKSPENKFSIQKHSKFMILIDPNLKGSLEPNHFQTIEEHNIQCLSATTVDLGLEMLQKRVMMSDFGRKTVCVVCTNQNCEQVSHRIAPRSEVKTIYIFCYNLGIGEENIKKLGGKFSHAFTKRREIVDNVCNSRWGEFDSPTKIGRGHSPPNDKIKSKLPHKKEEFARSSAGQGFFSSAKKMSETKENGELKPQGRKNNDGKVQVQEQNKKKKEDIGISDISKGKNERIITMQDSEIKMQSEGKSNAFTFESKISAKNKDNSVIFERKIKQRDKKQKAMEEEMYKHIAQTYLSIGKSNTNKELAKTFQRLSKEVAHAEMK